ncbi:MAG: hypothetical protein JXQ23_08530, partial [Clostridia bacterium]|nr:hypothetical protein [Clostridia bacterium]
MITGFENGKLITRAKNFEKVYYNVANEKIMAQFDGKACISQYSIANRCNVLVDNSFYLNLSLENTTIPFDGGKSVTMIGKNQDVIYSFDDITILTKNFTDEKSNAIFTEIQISGNDNMEVDINFGYLIDLSAFKLFCHADAFKKSDTAEYITVKQSQNGLSIESKIADHYSINIACSDSIILREIEGAGYHYTVHKNKSSVNERICLVFSACFDKETSFNVMEGLKRFDEYYACSEKYIEMISSFDIKDSEMIKAMAVSSLNCCLSSYKSIDGFKGFFAGINYQTPARTYYRDSYFTCIPVIDIVPSLVKEQILTLSKGVDEFGKCPSAVTFTGEKFWPDHIDSPMFYIILVNDYIEKTNDIGILDVIVDGRSVMDIMRCISNHLIRNLDENNLLAREPFNRHDWADNVYRVGYVTYIQCLLYKSVLCMSQMLHISGENGQLYKDKADEIKESINTCLWDDHLGYYINYRDSNHLEDHLSIDTVLAVIFDIADDDRKLMMLKKMEALLETGNNVRQSFGDWGVMSVFPFYKYKEHLVEKSSEDYIYHNGSDWPYLSCLYAYAKKKCHLDYQYPLTRWFTYSISQGWFTPVEYYNPVSGRGSLLQGWSGMAGIILNEFYN